MQKPVAIRRNSAGLAAMRSALVGSYLNAVRYPVAAGDRWPDGHQADSVVHEIEMGLSANVGDAVWNVTWSMDGQEEGLAVVSGAVAPNFYGRSATMTDVSGVAPWPSLVGRMVTNLSWAWHQPYDKGTELLWALRIDFDSGVSAVLALGVIENGRPRYLPDSLLVIFDEGMARSYSIPASESPSWGGPVD